MKNYRYLLAGIFSLLIHGVALSFSTQKQEVSLASSNEGHAVSIKFVSLAQPEKQAEKKEVEPQPLLPEKSTPKESEAKEQAQLKKAKLVEKPKKKVEKKSPVTKPVKPQPTKTAKNEPKPTLTEPVETKSKETPKDKPVEQKREKEVVQPQTASSNAASSSKPKMVEKPTFSAKPTPVSYPRLAQKRGWQGSTLVEIWINEEGKQIKQTVVNSSGHRLLDKAALNAVSEWQFQRRNEQGQRIAYRVQVPINFQLN
ncbi:cell envelope biogenesis protein TonB [Vibrio inusitatus NBRC 102082]|uniref:Cell envelope biogenesis protein TonB n=1 Tax=Vibrio inusitatus NBRC 102082 TaxID=1219070 RepID=A0A4Y3HY03_9VIBR|nr:energy transducer TonB [Vibrio inusitatus]GEA51915.1 cell envelope biogenesis protein TonB [Vibrio inusitatus NBRC 102082]